MVGGHASHAIDDERVFRVEFPERPGALMKFLNALGKQFDISLFHYRNHGAAFGRILVGFNVPRGKRSALKAVLVEVGYRHWEETDNGAYRNYLGRAMSVDVPVIVQVDAIQIRQ